MSPLSGITLYVWPSQWGLPTFDPLCLATVLFLQQTIPGRFQVVECTDPDSSPSGQLPFLIHDQHIAAGFSSIVKYISNLHSSEHAQYPAANLDNHLSSLDKSQRTAWSAHVHSHLGNLVYYSLYSSYDNWSELVHPALAGMFPVPQKYYVPRRVRDGYYSRLSTAGFWSHQQEKEPAKPFAKPAKVDLKDEIKKNVHVFQKEKVLEKAQVILDLYQDLLHGKTYVFQERPTTLDILIAAHVLLLIKPPFPDAGIQNLVKESYPNLASHAERVYNLAFGGENAALSVVQPQRSLWSLLLPSRPKLPKGSKEVSPEEKMYTTMRYGFFGVVLGAFATYMAVISRKYQLVIVRPEDSTGEDVES